MSKGPRVQELKVKIVSKAEAGAMQSNSRQECVQKAPRPVKVQTSGGLAPLLQLVALLL